MCQCQPGLLTAGHLGAREGEEVGEEEGWSDGSAGLSGSHCVCVLAQAGHGSFELFLSMGASIKPFTRSHDSLVPMTPMHGWC